MDQWIIALGILAGCISALVIVLITCWSVGGKSYEEVIADQRKRQAAEKEKARNDKKLEKEFIKRKYKKGKGNKSKEKAETKASNDSQAEKETKMVNLEIEPEIIEPVQSGMVANKKGKNSSAARKRSILHNKDEKTPVTEKATELYHKPVKPLDDVELKKAHDAKQHETPAEKKGKGQRGGQKQTPAQEMPAQKTKATGLQHEGAAGHGDQGNKRKSPSGASGNALTASVRSTEASKMEVLTSVETITRMSHDTGISAEGSWNKKGQKGDPMTVMKKQLEDREKALQAEQLRSVTLAKQVKDLRSSLVSEKEKMSGTEKRLVVQLSQQEAEKEALQAHLADIHATHMADTATLKHQLEQFEGLKSTEAALCLKLKQENKILQDSLAKAVVDNVSKGDIAGLKQKVSIMEKELSNNALRLNAADNIKKSSEEKLKKYEEQIKKLQSSQTADEGQKKQVGDLKDQVQRAERQKGQLGEDLKKATSALGTVEAECAMWKTKLQELEKHLSSLGDVGTKLQQSEDKRQEVESNLRNLEKQMAESVRTRQDLSTELQQLKQEKTALSQELKVLQENQQTQASSTVNANGDVHAHKDDKNLIQVAEHERIVSEKVAELSKIQTALDTQTKKNNELRQKNWKAMEALENTEKLAAKKVDKALDTSREEMKEAVAVTQRSDRHVLKRLFPAVSLSDNMEHKEWLSSFEKQAIQFLQKSSSTETDLCHKMSHLEDENNRLKADVEVFKNNIAILHSEKDRIHQLEEENRKLQHQSETYEKNFMQLNADQEKLLHQGEENKKQLKSSTTTNTSLSEDISRLQEENENLQSRLQEREENIAEVENKLHNLERVVETEEKKWKEKLRQAEEAATKKSESSGREQELEDLMVQQQTQIEHYRSVLTDTEQVLRQLESAEKTWEEKLKASQDDLDKSKADCQKAQEELHSLRGSTEDLSDLGFAYRCVEKSLTSIVDEMQGKVADLQEELRQSHEKLDGLTQEKEQLTSRVIVMESQSKAIVQVGTEDLKKELEEVKKHLESERKRNKELSSTLVRLNGIIKTGQDALSQEQKLVQQLQEQLTDRNKTSGSGANQEIEQLRSKLSEKEKQLEREIAANRQLSQRLGTSTGSEQGTPI